MGEFVRRIVEWLTAEGKRLSVVKNPDGFLLRADTQETVYNESGLLLLPIKSGIELRVRYELQDKQSDQRVCYIMEHPDDVLPDIKSHLYIASTFTVAKLMPACNEMELLQAKMTFGMASYIFNKRYTRNLSLDETRTLLLEAENLYGMDLQTISAELKTIPLHWDKVETIDSISNILLNVINRGLYHMVEPIIEELNSNFQEFVDNRYFSFINSSSILKPKMVHKILPHLAHNHQRTDKVALIVIDGMTFWQYLLLDKALNNIGIQTKKDMTYAWLPSITKLSRQAIFRGESPHMDYRQSPAEESKLWTNFWTSRPQNRRLEDYEIAYTHGSLILENNNYYRQAMVETSLDEKMHSLNSNKDLYALTKNWAEVVTNDIKDIYEQGYHIYITTDHGNVLANPWRSLKPQEKTYLYERDSRGNRYLIYNKTAYLRDFIQSNPEIESDLLVHDDWAVWRKANSFDNKHGITHGGAHFLEVVIPFITIKKK